MLFFAGPYICMHIPIHTTMCIVYSSPCMILVYAAFRYTYAYDKFLFVSIEFHSKSFKQWIHNNVNTTTRHKCIKAEQPYENLINYQSMCCICLRLRLFLRMHMMKRNRMPTAESRTIAHHDLIFVLYYSCALTSNNNRRIKKQTHRRTDSEQTPWR